MFILTSSDRLINSDRLKEIYHIENVIFAHTEDKDEAVLLNCCENEQECEHAFNELVKALAERKELYRFDTKG